MYLQSAREEPVSDCDKREEGGEDVVSVLFSMAERLLPRRAVSGGISDGFFVSLPRRYCLGTISTSFDSAVFWSRRLKGINTSWFKCAAWPSEIEIAHHTLYTGLGKMAYCTFA